MVPSPRRGGVAEHSDVRRANLALALGVLRREGAQSRARLATRTGLTRATVSSLVAELVDRGLARDGEVERGAVGRPGQTVQLTGRVCGLGVEVNVDYVAVHVLDLCGDDVLERRITADVPSLGATETMRVVATAVTAALAEVESTGRVVVGIALAVPGLVAVEHGTVRLAPNLQWRDFSAGAHLATLLGRDDIPVTVDNDANLSALAEYTCGASAGTRDLVYLTGEVGVGAGVLVGGDLLRGADGFGGEVGHMPVAVDGPECGCGRRGCWETFVGLQALLRGTADPADAVRDPAVDLETRMWELRRRAHVGDARTLEGLAGVGTALGRGAAILAQILNPQVIVLGGFFSVLGDFLIPTMKVTLLARSLVPSRSGACCRIEASRLGFTAAARGGALVALDPVLADPSTVPAPSLAGAAHE